MEALCSNFFFWGIYTSRTPDLSDHLKNFFSSTEGFFFKFISQPSIPPSLSPVPMERFLKVMNVITGTEMLGRHI